MSMYILIVITYVNSGSMITMQEFNSKASCIEARNYVSSELKGVLSSLVSTTCVGK
jgi:hypothetical protein